MTVVFPQIVVSRDGRKAISVVELGSHLRTPSDFDGFDVGTIVHLSPRAERCAIDFRVSGSFRAMWDIDGQTLKWDADFATALPELGLIATAQFLDSHDVPAQPSGDEYAARILVSTGLFDIFRQAPASDAELAEYVRGKILWSWRFKNEATRFETWEARRLGVTLADLHQAAFAQVNTLWTKDGGDYSALPTLIAQASVVKPVSAATDTRKPYDVALSFAGEQRTYVERVAATLRAAGAEVFYDYYVDLWGKDLTKELEQVYRHGSRFVVIFVSKEYVEKAWPNLERQHALAGRIERMDDSVLPARFDAIELPGLPVTVGYRDIHAESPEDLSQAILGKLAQASGA